MHGLFQLSFPFTQVENSLSLFLVYSISFQVIPSEDMERKMQRCWQNSFSQDSHISQKGKFPCSFCSWWYISSPSWETLAWLLSSAMILTFTSPCTYSLRIWPWCKPGYHPQWLPSCWSVSLQRAKWCLSLNVRYNLFSFGTRITTECFLLATAVYDCYVAICKPLLYPVIMTNRLCIQLLVSSFLGGLFHAILHNITFIKIDLL